ncbi:MAG: hypothetical protein ACOZHQ_13455 [Thermodesulfobacteriota bacterium]
MSADNPPRPTTFGRHQAELLARRPPRAWLERVQVAGFSLPDLLAPEPATPARPANEPLSELDGLARSFAGRPAAVALAQALWLAQCAQRHLRRGRILTAHSLAARALAAKPDLFSIYAVLGSALRQKAQAGGLFGPLHQALDLFETMPRVMSLLGWRLGLDQCGSLVYAEWAAAQMLLGDHAGAAVRIGMALAAQARAAGLPDGLRDFLLQAGCLADDELAADLARARERLLRG